MPGNFYPYPEGGVVTLDLQLARPDDPTQAPAGGFEITGTLSWGDGNNSVAASDPISFTPGTGSLSATGPTSGTLSFPIDMGNLSAGEQVVGLALQVTQLEAGDAIPIPTEAGVVCNSAASQFSEFQYARGQVGDGDIDGDRIPDSEDDDRDGDGVPNTEEEQLTCGTQEDVNFADDPDLMPGEADSDGDGQTDEFECANAGGDPFSGLTTVPQPAGVPWLLIIILLVIVLLIVGIIFLFLKFGRVADLTIVSNAELIIDSGKVAKFEVAAESRKKSGDPITFQLSVEGMPEGWDARTEVDHVTLESQDQDGARKTFFLEVEAPQHDDPESAEIAVKAIPLNKQGRKDTFKVAAKAGTITSINVPPDAKVPVKRGGPIKLKSAEEDQGPASMPIPPEGLPVRDIPGIGDAAAKKLAAAGVETTEQLRTADADALAAKTKLGQSDIQRWQHVSDLIRVPGVDPEYGDVLVDAGFSSPGKLAAAKPEEIMEKVNAKAEPPASADLDVEVS
jgi:predicted flap endonuclease-1-like 5' DNA nuclease